MYHANINIDFSKQIGTIKDMHSVNNGPVGGRAHSSGASNAKLYTDAMIPFARNHDANFFCDYGAPHTVDILAIFPRFDADENDPASYDFHLTDEYNAAIVDAGTQVFYRLGNKIEHESKKYGSVPPADPHKFARICEHIIRHMNEGWADGTHLNIEYWEIWNEPDLCPACWTGSKEEFYQLFDITARHLKSCFPHLKIGGPAVTNTNNTGFVVPFLEYLTRDPADPTPLDFFSFHCYSTSPDVIAAQPAIARELLDRYGYQDTETILNEWNYVRSFSPSEVMLYNKSVIPSLKGSAFAASTILACQHSCLDHLMYYDAAAASIWNGLFHKDTYQPMKPYFAFYGFSRLYRLKNEAACTSDIPQVYAAAARSDDETQAAIMASYYKDADGIDATGYGDETLKLRVDWSGFAGEQGVKVTYHLLDGNHNLEPVSEEVFFGQQGAHMLSFPLYSTILITMEKL